MPPVTETLKPATAAAVDIELWRVHPAPWNKERPITPEFIQTFLDKGQLVDAMVRPHPDPDREGEFQLVYGHRRAAALKEAGMVVIHALIRDLSDQQARELAALENKQREGLTPWQEAELIEEHLEIFGEDTAGIAAALGMTQDQVRRRRKFLDLSPKWRKAFAEDMLPGWGPGHFELLTVFSKDQQEDLHDELEGYDMPHTIQELRQELSRAMQTLKHAPWKLDDEALVPEAGSCNACPKRTGIESDLFDDPKGKAKGGDRCLDGACFAKKRAAHLVRREVELKEKHPDLVKVSKEDWSGREGALGTRDFKQAKKTDKGAVPALVVDGAGAGQLTYIKPNKDSTAGARAAAKVEGGGKTPLKDRKKALEKRRRVAVLGKLYSHVDGELEWPAKDRDLVIALIHVFGTDNNSDYRMKGTWEKVALNLKQPPTVEELWERVRGKLLDQIQSDRNSYDLPDFKEAKQIAELTSFDLEAARKEVDEEIPEPKAWANEAAAERMAKPEGKKKPKFRDRETGEVVEDDDLADDGDEAADLDTDEGDID